MTRLLEYLGEALDALWRNKLRSILTMLGMIIGVAAVASVFGISHAATAAIAQTLGANRLNVLDVAPDPQQNDPNAAALRYRDAAVVADALGSMAVRVIPAYQRGFEARNGPHHVFAMAASAWASSFFHAKPGRIIDRRDVRDGAAVCLLSKSLAQKLFPKQSLNSVVGRTMLLDGNRVKIIGIYSVGKGALFSNLGGDFALLPYTTMRGFFPNGIDHLAVFPATNVATSAIKAAVISVLHKIHGPRTIYQTQSRRQIIEKINGVISIIAAGLTALGGISLIVAGIGIMNIMLVSVSERTREIGIRKAIGAKRADIILQFLIEATLLSLIGGGLGLMLGLAIMLVTSAQIGHIFGETKIPYAAVLSIAFFFSCGIGLLFGVYPAVRASKLDPIEALRS
ncbi:MAG: ABC transporter permease [Vulcanimicrobiaceae bacterium]